MAHTFPRGQCSRSLFDVVAAHSPVALGEGQRHRLHGVLPVGEAGVVVQDYILALRSPGHGGGIAGIDELSPLQRRQCRRAFFLSERKTNRGRTGRESACRCRHSCLRSVPGPGSRETPGPGAQPTAPRRYADRPLAEPRAPAWRIAGACAKPAATAATSSQRSSGSDFSGSAIICIIANTSPSSHRDGSPAFAPAAPSWPQSAPRRHSSSRPECQRFPWWDDRRWRRRRSVFRWDR